MQASQAAADTALQVLYYTKYYTHWWLCDLLIVLGCHPQCHHDLLREISRLSSAPADTFPFCMVHVPKIIQSSRLTHLTQTREKQVSCSWTPLIHRVFTLSTASVASPCQPCPLLYPSASDSKPPPHQTAPKPLMCCQGFHWLWLLQAGRRLSCKRHVI